MHADNAGISLMFSNFVKITQNNLISYMLIINNINDYQNVSFTVFKCEDVNQWHHLCYLAVYVLYVIMQINITLKKYNHLHLMLIIQLKHFLINFSLK